MYIFFFYRYQPYCIFEAEVDQEIMQKTLKEYQEMEESKEIFIDFLTKIRAERVDRYSHTRRCMPNIMLYR